MATILVKKHRNEIHVYTPWVDGGALACKSVDGATWDNKRKCWKYPLLWQVCLDIRAKIAIPLEMEIELDPKMSEWAYIERDRQKAIPDVLSLTAVPLDNLPTMNPVLYGAASNRPFQTVGIKFIAMNGEVLLADDPGLGKTMQTIGAFQEADIKGPILVIAPKAAALITWPNEIRKWTDNEKVLVFGAHIPPAKRQDTIEDVFIYCDDHPDERYWVIMNPYWLRTRVELDEYGKYVRGKGGAKISKSVLPIMFYSDILWSGVVVDESHTTLAGSTGNAKKWSLQRLGLGALNLENKSLRVAISGTPFRGKPENLYGTLQWLRPKLYTSYWNWIRRHFETEADRYGQQIGGLIDEDTFYKEAATVMLRRNKSQVAPDLPPKMYGGTPLIKENPDSVVGVWLPMEKEQERQYWEMAKGAESEIADGKVEAIGLLAEMTRMKQFSNSAMKQMPPRWVVWSPAKRQRKFDELKFHLRDLDKTDEQIWKLIPEGEEIIEYKPTLPSNKVLWIEEFLDDRDLVGKGAKGKSKILISSQFTGFINMLAEYLEKIGVHCYVLTGETSDKTRVAIADDFQNNPNSPKVFLLNTKAGGVSLTLDQADDVIICDETFIPDDQLQVEDRAHRLSRTDHNVTIWYLRSLGTIEETIGETTTERENICRGILDRARGVDYKKLLTSSSNR